MLIKSLLSHTTLEILQEAIHEELFASNLYKHLSNQCKRAGLSGAAKFFQGESGEELEHYQKIADYINDRGAVAEIPAIESFADKAITSLTEAINVAYDAEDSLGAKYGKWYSTIVSNDPTTAQFLLEFLNIQADSIGFFYDFKSRLNIANGNEAAILMIDKELGKS